MGASHEVELRDFKGKPEAEKHTVAEMLIRYSEEISEKKDGARHEQLRINAFIRDFPKIAELTLAELKTPVLGTWRDARLKGYAAPDDCMVVKVAPASIQRDVNWLRNACTVARLVDPRREVRSIVRAPGYRTGQGTDNEKPRGSARVHGRAALGELLAMAKEIGVAKKYIQKAGSHGEHFNIGKSYRDNAIAAGAVEIMLRQCSATCVRRARLAS